MITRIVKKKVFLGASALAAKVVSGLSPGRDQLLSFVFHAIARENGRKDLSVLPALGLPISSYRIIFEYFLENSYEFVSSRDIFSGLPRGGRYAHVTFDDGYYNNLSILPLLKEYDIPADIFVTTSNIQKNEKFWWDVVFTQLRRVGKNDREIAQKITRLKGLGHQETYDHLHEVFGANAFVPGSDEDRPLTPTELRCLARENLISIGNHTRDHVLLAGCSAGVVEEQISTAQEDLKDLIGKRPSIFAFPNGSYSDTAIEVLDKLGFQLGFSSDFRVHKLSKGIEGKNRLTLGRASFFPTFDLSMQCANFRIPLLSPIVSAKRVQRKFARSQ